MKQFLILLIIVLCGALAFIVAQMRNDRIGAEPVQAMAQMQTTNTEYIAPTMQPSNTPVPSPTIGYESTLAVAQSTADEARRVNAEVTAQHEVHILSMAQLTAAHEQRELELARMTANAAPTIYPMTQTQQAALNTQVAQEYSIQAGALTATKHAPTQINAMAQAQAAVEFARMTRISDVVGKWVLIGFMLILSIFVFSRWRVPMPAPESVEPQTETVVQMRRDHSGGSVQYQRAVVPCSPEQLTELAEGLLSGKKTFAINQWEGAHTKFTRPIIHQVRVWFQEKENGFAVANGDGQLALTEDGHNFLIGWLESQKLPAEYEFGESDNLSPSAGKVP